MSRFIYRAIFFSALVLVIFAVNYFVNSLLISIRLPDTGGAEIVVTGDSHTRTAVNPDKLPGSVNISQNAETYFITYHKLQKVLSANAGIKKVIVGFSYHNLSAFNDIKLVHAKWARTMFERIYPIVGLSDLHGHEADKKKYLRVLTRKMILFPMLNYKPPYMGGFLKKTPALAKSKVEIPIQRHYYQEGEPAGASAVMAGYLDSIAVLCQKREVELILVSTPLHKRYLERVPENFMGYFQNVKDEMALKGIRFLDYSSHPLDDRYFHNYDHVNLDGANLITEEISRDLKSPNAE